MSYQTLSVEADFTLECGQVLPGIDIAYHTYGKLNSSGDNVVWICHALTANSDAKDWWPGMIGPEYIYNPEKYFIVCANILGSCYGSTGPTSTNPSTGQPWLNDFPIITVRDMVRAHQLLREHLGIKRIFVITGGSLGGQQALEWAWLEPDLFDYLIPIATNAVASPWGIAFNESQRMALEADPDFNKGILKEDSPGLRAARSIALLSYRNAFTYNKTQEEEEPDKFDGFKVCSYQQYQGLKLQRRFDPYSYYTMSKALDSQNLGRNRGGVEVALSQIKAKTLVIGIKTDLLFPVDEQQRIAAGIPGAIYAEIDSFYGHDGFLLEHEAITKEIEKLIVKK